MSSIKDPTREEMLAFLASLPFASDHDEFDHEEAIYWFASDWHNGQWSNLYSALCTSPYKPGPLANGPEPGGAGAMLYVDLEQEYTDTEH